MVSASLATFNSDPTGGDRHLDAIQFTTDRQRLRLAEGVDPLPVAQISPRSYERIHRSNLIGMGILPLEFPRDESAETLGLNGHEEFALEGLAEIFDGDFSKGRPVQVVATPADGEPIRFEAKMRIDTPQEAEYYRHGGILQYVLRQLL